MWVGPDNTRNDIIKKFPNNLIISLPQSINYRNKKNLEFDQNLFSQVKKKLVLLSRTFEGYDFLKENFINKTNNNNDKIHVEFVPDMAFMIGPVALKSSRILYDILFLKRDDHESNIAFDKDFVLNEINLILGNKYSYLLIDWQNYNKHLKTISDYTNLNKTLFAKFEYTKEIFSTVRLVITDRLHASIFSVLVGKPHIIIDDKYKKISQTRDAAFFNKPECSSANLQAYYATNITDAFQLAVKILS